MSSSTNKPVVKSNDSPIKARKTSFKCLTGCKQVRTAVGSPGRRNSDQQPQYPLNPLSRASSLLIGQRISPRKPSRSQTELKHCVICLTAIPYSGKLYKNLFWRDMSICENCGTQKRLMKSCDLCRRPVGHGWGRKKKEDWCDRIFCVHCMGTGGTPLIREEGWEDLLDSGVVRTKEQLGKASACKSTLGSGIYGVALRYLRDHHGMTFPHAPLISVSSSTLKTSCGTPAMGLTKSYFDEVFSESKQKVIPLRKNSILLTSAPAVLIETTLVHELVHCWAWQVGARLCQQDYDYDTEEALCDALTYEFVRHRMVLLLCRA
eukprot:GHVH01014870.1.p1 GENE.GHVH01014870.1~~GHVH01014870.1.p1  ORF type:complete len:320 (-),score=24.86 GHVH01014870.1:659-1618(-)